jgi:hypothetical protein
MRNFEKSPRKFLRTFAIIISVALVLWAAAAVGLQFAGGAFDHEPSEMDDGLGSEARRLLASAFEPAAGSEEPHRSARLSWIRERLTATRSYVSDPAMPGLRFPQSTPPIPTAPERTMRLPSAPTPATAQRHPPQPASPR